ncbi:hypothetical protein Q5P01_020589 [Channa striata]|uniref:Uncharacterized protein n=1 Tax=Channa striata TaxID=64152 RepID=A0AA88S970_CHASR|nr:hypothetical protein Q5P01_020589 [Channa striata]
MEVKAEKAVCLATVSLRVRKLVFDGETPKAGVQLACWGGGGKRLFFCPAIKPLVWRKAATERESGDSRGQREGERVERSLDADDSFIVGREKQFMLIPHKRFYSSCFEPADLSGGKCVFVENTSHFFGLLAGLVWL